MVDIASQEPTFTKIYVPVVTLSTQDNIKLLKKKKESGFKNRYLDFSINPSFQGVNRLFDLTFDSRPVRESHKQDIVLTVKIKNRNFMINGRNFFDQPVKKI